MRRALTVLALASLLTMATPANANDPGVCDSGPCLICDPTMRTLYPCSHSHERSGDADRESGRAWSRHVKAYNRGTKSFQNKRWRDAIAAFEEALLHSWDEETAKLLVRTRGILLREEAQALALSGDYDGALAKLEIARTVDPDGSEYTDQNVRWVEGLREEARLRRKEQEDAAWQQAFDAATAHFDAGRYEEAEAGYRKMLEQRPRDAWVHYCLANTLVFRGDLDQAEKWYRSSLAIDRKNASALANLGKLLSGIVNYEESEALLREALLVDPTNVNARKGLEVIHKAWWQAAVEGWPDSKARAARKAVEDRAAWRAAVRAKLEKLEVPPKDDVTRTYEELREGDVILIAAADASSLAVAIGDLLFTGRDPSAANPSHALTFLGKDREGRGLFLDNTTRDFSLGEKGGARIIGETEFHALYGERARWVARPTTSIEGKSVLREAVKIVEKAKRKGPGSDYGILGKGDAVCSETAALAIVRAKGGKDLTELVPNRLFVDLTPSDFFDAEHAGKYFYVTPLFVRPRGPSAE